MRRFWALLGGALLISGCAARPVVYPIPEHTRVVTFRNLHIDKLYPSMFGPWKSDEHVDLGLPFNHNRYAWIVRYKAQVLDQDGRLGQPEYMCHSNLSTLPSRPDVPEAFRGDRSQLSISQGQEEIVFPTGYALRLDNIPERTLGVTGMVLNNNQAAINKTVQFQVSIGYYGDVEASQLRLKPLVQTSAAILLPVEKANSGGGPTCEPVRMDETFCGNNTRLTGHWYVPPGRHTYTTDVTDQLCRYHKGTRVHYIWMHVHPYAVSMSLLDKTLDQVIWKGYACNAKDRAALLGVDHYQGADGLELPAYHTYEVAVEYDNQTDHPIDAMAALWMYVDPD